MERLQKRMGERVTFLSDPSATLPAALGQLNADGVPWYDKLAMGARQKDLAYPATLLIDPAGRIRFFHRSARIDDRPPVSKVLAAWTKPS